MEFTNDAMEIFRSFHYKMPIHVVDDFGIAPPGAPLKPKRATKPKLVEPVVPKIDTIPGEVIAHVEAPLKRKRKTKADKYYDPSNVYIPTKEELEAMGEKLEVQKKEKAEAREKEIEKRELEKMKKTMKKEAPRLRGEARRLAKKEAIERAKKHADEAREHLRKVEHETLATARPIVKARKAHEALVKELRNLRKKKLADF